MAAVATSELHSSVGAGETGPGLDTDALTILRLLKGMVKDRTKKHYALRPAPTVEVETGRIVPASVFPVRPSEI